MEADSPWGWQRLAHLDHDLYQDACLALERYVTWSEERREEYVARLMVTGAVSEQQGNQLLKLYCSGIEDE